MSFLTILCLVWIPQRLTLIRPRLCDRCKYHVENTIENSAFESHFIVICNKHSFFISPKNRSLTFPAYAVIYANTQFYGKNVFNSIIRHVSNIVPATCWPNFLLSMYPYTKCLHIYT